MAVERNLGSAMTTETLWRLGVVDFGGNLREVRRDRGLTQQQLADILGVQQRVVSRWETGAAAPHLNHMVLLAKALEVGLDRLAFGADHDHPRWAFEIRNRRLKELCRQVDELDQADQDTICHVMDSLINTDRVGRATAG